MRVCSWLHKMNYRNLKIQAEMIHRSHMLKQPNNHLLHIDFPSKISMDTFVFYLENSNIGLAFPTIQLTQCTLAHWE